MREYRRRRKAEGRPIQQPHARERNNRHKYGIEPEEYDRMLSEQDGVCAICKGPPTRPHFHIDHDHSTGRVRGLLCHRCNTALGGLNDDPALLRAALNYLEGDNTGS